jgi:hypothetical protein
MRSADHVRWGWVLVEPAGMLLWRSEGEDWVLTRTSRERVVGNQCCPG